MGITGKDADISTLHKKTIIQTYLILGIAFTCMIGINIYAYFTIINMNEVYTSLDNAAINIELNSTKANLLFREIVSGYTKDKDMNDVWGLVREAKEYCAEVKDIDGQKGMLTKINEFNDVMVKCYKAYRDPDIVENKGLVNDLRNQYDSAYLSLLGEIEKIKFSIKKLIVERMFTFKVLYVALLINFLLLFWFTMFTFRRYIEKRKAVETALLTAKNDITLIINSLDSMVITVTPDGIVTQWNRAAEKGLDIPAERAIGRAVWITLPFLMPYKTKIQTMPLSGKSEEFYGERISTENERYFNIALNVLSKGKGVVIRLEDMTEIELKNEQLRHAQKMEVVKNLIGGLAHDFNNVLGAITGTISMMRYSIQNKTRSLDEFEGDMNVIESSTERAVVMVQQLLTLSSEHEVSLAPLDLNDIVINCLKICQNTFDKRIELAAELYDLKVMVKADSAQLQQCILNICDNAALAMTSMRENEQDYGGVLTASIDLIYPDKKFRAEHPKAKQSSYWCLSITDTGVGMSRETIADIFDPFYTTRDPSESTGLGLTLVRDIIQQHNGFLEVDSAPGQGSVFRIYLPEITRAGTDSASKRQTEVSASDQIPTGSGLIFVVDDEDIMRKTAGNILEKLGYDVIFAEDGEEAVSIYRENFKDIKVVLLDMAMPKMSGKDAYIEMKKINPKIKSLLVSGFKKDDRIAEALEAGINGFIQKPYSMITLAQEVKRLSLAG